MAKTVVKRVERRQKKEQNARNLSPEEPDLMASD